MNRPGTHRSRTHCSKTHRSRIHSSRTHCSRTHRSRAHRSRAHRSRAHRSRAHRSRVHRPRAHRWPTLNLIKMLYVLEVLNLLNRPMTHRWPTGPCFLSYCMYFYDIRLIHLVIDEIGQLGIIAVYHDSQIMISNIYNRLHSEQTLARCSPSSPSSVCVSFSDDLINFRERT